jgi:hypothetical protein
VNRTRSRIQQPSPILIRRANLPTTILRERRPTVHLSADFDQKNLPSILSAILSGHFPVVPFRMSYDVAMPTTRSERPVPITRSERSANARLAAQNLAADRKAKKIVAIGERRAAAKGLTRQEFIAEIVKGKYPPITADDIAAEPVPE